VSKGLSRKAGDLGQPSADTTEMKMIMEVDPHKQGLENLSRRYIKLHGLCHPPRVRDGEAGEEKEQYVLVRLPRDCKVKWKPNHPYYKVECKPDAPVPGYVFRRSTYNNRLSCMEWIKKIIGVCFNRTQLIMLR
jgi:hypothetical protein